MAATARTAEGLKRLMKATPQQRREILEQSPATVNNLCHLAKMILTEKKRKKAQAYKESLRALASKRTSLGKKKKLLQRGGLLGALGKHFMKTAPAAFAHSLAEMFV